MYFFEFFASKLAKNENFFWFLKKNDSNHEKIISKTVITSDRKKQIIILRVYEALSASYCYKLNTPSRFENRQAPRRSNNQRRVILPDFF